MHLSLNPTIPLLGIYSKDSLTTTKYICRNSFIVAVVCNCNVIQNIPSQTPEKQYYNTAPWKEWCNSVRWIDIYQSTFSESFFLVFIWGYFLLYHIPQWALEYSIADSREKVLANFSIKGTLWLCEMNWNITKQFHRKLLFCFYLRIFPLSQ